MALDTYAAITLADFKATLGISSTADDAQLEQAINVATALVEGWLDRCIVERRFLDWIAAYDTVMLRNSPVSSVHFCAYGAATAFVPSSTQPTDVVSTIAITASSVVARRVDAAGVETISTASFTAYPTAASIVAWMNGLAGFAATLHQNCSSRYLHRAQSIDLRRSAPTVCYADNTLEPNRVDTDTGIVFFSSFDRWGDPRNRGRLPIVVDYTAGWPLASVPRDIQQAVRKVAAAAFYQRKRDPSMAGETLGDYSYTVDPVGVLEGEAAQLLQRWRRVR
jgi:hypothetical protein